MKTGKQFMMAVLASAILAACSKDKTTPDTGSNNGGNNNGNGVTLKEEEKFLVGDWLFEKAVDTFRSTYKPDEPEITEGTIPCKMDDVYHLRADKKYTKDEGKDSCNKNAVYREEDWKLEYGGIIFADGPNPEIFANTFTKIDNDHFSIAWGTQVYQGHKTNVYFFKRK